MKVNILKLKSFLNTGLEFMIENKVVSLYFWKRQRMPYFFNVGEEFSDFFLEMFRGS